MFSENDVIAAKLNFCGKNREENNRKKISCIELMKLIVI